MAEIKGRNFFILLIMAALLTVITIGVSNWAQKGNWSYVNLAPEAAATAYQTPPGRAPQDGGSPACVNDRDDTGMGGYWVGNVSKDKFNWVQLEWSKEKEIERVVISSSKKRFDYHPVSYELQAWDGEDFQTKVKVEGNDAELVTYDFKDEDRITTKKLRLYIAEVSNPLDLALVSEIYVYQKLPAWEAFFKYTLKEVLSFIFYPLIFLMILFLPGYVFLNRFSNLLDREEKFVLSFALTIFLFFMVSILCLGIKMPQGIYYILVSLLAYSLYIFIKKKLYLELKLTNRPLIFAFLLAIFFHIFFQLLFGGSIFEGDYFLDYNVSQIFFKGIAIKSPEVIPACWGCHLTDRTVLHSIVSIPFYTFFGNRFFIYQMLAIVLVALSFLSLFLLARRLFGQKSALIAVWFFLLNPSFIWFSIKKPTRLFAIYFILLFFYFLLTEKKKNKYLMAGFFSGLAYMVHPYALVFVAGGWLYILLRQISFRSRMRNLIRTVIPLIIFFIPWTLWSWRYDRISRIFLIPFSSSYYTHLLSQTRPAERETLLLKNLFLLISKAFSKEALLIKLQNFLGVFTGAGIYRRYGIDDWFLNPFTFFHTLPGTVMFSLFLFLLYGLVKSSRLFKRELFSFILIPLIIDTACWGFYVGALVGAQAVVPLLVVFAVYTLGKIGNKSLLFIIYNLCLLEHFYVAWFIIYDRRLVLSKALGGDLLFLIGVVSLLAWYMLNEFLVWGYAQDMEEVPLKHQNFK